MAVPSLPRSPRFLLAMGLAAWLGSCGFFLVRGRGLLPPQDQDQTPQVAADYAARGASFIHGVPSVPDLHMNLPLSTVWAGLAFDQWGASLRSYKTAVLACLLVLLAAVCVVLCPSSPWPLPAAVLLLGLCLSPDFLVYPQLEYAFLVLLAAGLMVWRSRVPSWGASLVLSLAVGTSLLFRSPLVFFPPLLALEEWLRTKKKTSVEKGLTPYWKHAAILCVAPYLFLLPWARMNWVQRRQVILLEGGQASTNVVAGALGLTQTIEGDWSKLVDPGVDSGDPGAVMAWAAQEVGRHPLRYLESYARRIHLCLSRFPLLWFLALVSWWRFRDRPGPRQTGLLAAYFVLLHCAMAVDLRYLTPVWPLLAVLAACLAELPWRTSITPGRAGSGNRPAVLSGLSVLLAGLFLVLGLAAYTSAKVWAMAEAPALPWSEEAWAKALAARPRSAWLLAERAGQKLKQGDAESAVPDLEEAGSLRPDRVDYALDLAWARGLRSKGGFPLDWSLPSTVVDYRVKMAFHLYRGHAFSLQGRREAAQDEIARAKRIFTATVWVHGSENAPAERERILQEILVSRDQRFGEAAMEAVAGLGTREALAFCREVARVAPSAEQRCLGIIEAAADHDPAFAASSAKKSDSAALAPAVRHRLALLRQRLGDYRGAVAILKDLVRREPFQGLYFSDLGVNEFLAGSQADAVSHLRKAIELSPDRLAPYASLGAVYSRQGKTREAAEVYDQALAVSGKVRDPRVRDDIVKARHLAGQP
ncbi:MAG: tetratricopeptide repeat protein [Elusimicrobia bacterium]|nr:tetratricopeptide repeat protein [Elusimicrobiota bacterium]